MSELEQAFQEVHGVGEAKAEELAAIAREHEGDVPAELETHVRQAWDYYSAGRESYAGKFLRRAARYVDEGLVE